MSAEAVAIVPARWGSTRLPGKPLAVIAGKPMIRHVVERAARARSLSRVIVATDDERIAEAVRAFGGEAVMTGTQFATGTDRIAHVAASLPAVDLVVNVQGDEPLLDPGMIDEAVRPLLDDPSVQAGTLARRIEDPGELQNPGVVKVVTDRNGFALYFSRSPVPFSRDHPGEPPRGGALAHVGLYVFRRAFLLRYSLLPRTPLEEAEQLEQLRILEHGYRIAVRETRHRTVAVDTEADLRRVRAIMEATA
jgi:3-deoxy-manno-octulosonate cytidylyltransferase (CMP-KDO synthetase)